MVPAAYGRLLQRTLLSHTLGAVRMHSSHQRRRGGLPTRRYHLAPASVATILIKRLETNLLKLNEFSQRNETRCEAVVVGTFHDLTLEKL